MTKSQIEKVEETVKMESNVKVGDTIKVIKVDDLDKRRGISVGEKFEVTAVEEDDFIRVNLSAESNYPLSSTQYEVVSSEMNFAEMTEKLLAGEFEVGTELIADGFKSFYVDKALGGYGLAESKTAMIVSATINTGLMNGTWVVKEPEPTVEPVKEMSIEDIQKELGYKVKIVE